MKVFTFTKELQRRAIREGWYIFDNGKGAIVQCIDDSDHAQLEDDDEACVLARRAGVPITRAGYVREEMES